MRAVSGAVSETSAIQSHPSAANAPDYRIAIIGAGFSGTMTAIHLRRALPKDTRILLIERSGTFARGVAYAQTNAAHLLNVRAANMSAFPDDPGHFERWLENCSAEDREGVQITPAGKFSPRRLYGRYLQDTLSETLKEFPGGIDLLTEEVEQIARHGNGWRLLCQSTRSYDAAGVVLACGNLASPRPCDGVVFHNPWAEEALRGLTASDPVVIAGTGLTMVDLVLALHSSAFGGPVTVLSRRGLLPHPHAQEARPWPLPNFSTAERRSALALLRAVRREVRHAAEQNIGWRAVVDSLRPITTELWHGLKPQEQARFLRHARPYWDIHRHRMAPSAAAIIETWREQGKLRVLRGRIQSINSAAPGKAELRITSRDSNCIETMQAQRVIHATGLQAMQHGHDLITALLRDDFARLDDLALGLEANAELQLLNDAREPVNGLWALGPLVKGMFWECLAVPDIRVQAQALSQHIVAAQENSAALT